MWISDTSIKRPVFATMVIVSFMVLGAVSMTRVGIDLRLEVDPQAAAAEVREKVAAIRERLPEQIKDPTIQRFDVAALPIATYAVGSSSLQSDRIRRMVEDDLKPLLGQI